MDNLKILLLCGVLILIFFYLKHNGNILEYSQSDLPACPPISKECKSNRYKMYDGTSYDKCHCIDHSAERQPSIKSNVTLKNKCENSSMFIKGKPVKCYWQRELNTCLGLDKFQCDPNKPYQPVDYVPCNCAMDMVNKIDTLLPFIKYFEPNDYAVCTKENPNTYTSMCVLKSKHQAKADLGAEYDEEVWNILHKYMDTILESDKDSLITITNTLNGVGFDLCIGSILASAGLFFAGQIEGPFQASLLLAAGSCGEQGWNAVELGNCALKHKDILKLREGLDKNDPKYKLSQLLFLWQCRESSWVGNLP